MNFNVHLKQQKIMKDYQIHKILRLDEDKEKKIKEALDRLKAAADSFRESSR